MIKKWRKQMLAAVAAGIYTLMPITTLAASGSPVVLSGEVVSVSNCKVTVTVTDSLSTPLKGAEVIMVDKSLTTGADGKVAFEGFDLGETHTIEAKRSGYWSGSQEYHVTGDEGAVTLVLRNYSSDSGDNIPKESGEAPSEESLGPGIPEPSQEFTDQTTPGGDLGENLGGNPGQPPVSGMGGPVEPGQPKIEKIQEETHLPEQTDPANQGKPIVITSPSGEGAIRIKDPVVGESIERNAMVVVELMDPDGKQIEVSLPPFTAHDKQLYGNNELWVVSKKDGAELVIRVTEHQGRNESEALVPHNYAEAAIQWPADIRVEIQGTDETYLLPSSLFRHETYGQLDFGVEHDYSTGGTSLLYVLKGSHVEKALTAPKEAFRYASETKLPLKARIYNPEDQEELWYEWSFQPQSMNGLEAMDTDLYISPELSGQDGLGKYLWWRHSQPLSISHHGPLPGTAALRIRDQFGFRNKENVDFITLNEEGKREILYQNLMFDKDGFITIGEMTHCSSYALAGNLWWWVIAVPLILISLLIWRKLHEDRS